eukprot:TRINITY_DN78475_c0_g1_i1.p1 TRINITY_DN78475_c0_g1~~TRINITY_DN78475_c0_g1_i1.p1  ORF type:complete len:325 (-),score=34.88 TRINITY_DN78475_c0_g1_i1:52-1002(-)
MFRTLLLLCVLGHGFTAVAPGLYTVDGKLDLNRLDMKTGVKTKVGHINKELQAEQVSSMDSMHGILYMIGENSTHARPNLIGIDVKDGKVVYETEKLPFPGETMVGVGEHINVDAKTGIAYLVGPYGVSGKEWQVVAYNLHERKAHVVTKLQNVIPVLGVGSAYCPENHMLWIPTGVNNTIDMYGVNVDSGKIIHIKDGFSSGPIAYNPGTKEIAGLGIKIINRQKNEWKRELVSMSCTDGKVTGRATLDTPYTMANADLFTIDDKGEIGFAILAPLKAGKLGPSHLVEIDLKTKKIVRAPELKGARNWQLQYYNP